MTTAGVRVDLPLVQRRLEDWNTHADRLRQRLVSDFGFPACTADGSRAASPWLSRAGAKQLVEIVDGSSWPSAPDGSPALDRASLNSVIDSDEPESLKAVAEALRHLQSPPIFLQDLARHTVNHRAHPTYAQDTATGRWTSRKPNVHAAGRRTGRLLAQREVIMAGLMRTLIGVDLAGIEARCVAGLSGDVAYAEMVTGSDPHAVVSQRFFGSPHRREAAKAITHGVNYGRGSKSIADAVGTTEEQIVHLRDDYLSAYPGLSRWQDQVRRQARQSARVSTGTGRDVGVDPDQAHTQAPARSAQGAAADIAMFGLSRLVKAGLSSYLRLYLHDEVVLSVPSHVAADLLDELVDLMSFTWRSPSGLEIPIVANPLLTGKRWSSLYTKG